jgi:hypothetical protein
VQQPKELLLPTLLKSRRRQPIMLAQKLFPHTIDRRLPYNSLQILFRRLEAHHPIFTGAGDDNTYHHIQERKKEFGEARIR